jgi:hypothetical protein
MIQTSACRVNARARRRCRRLRHRDRGPSGAARPRVASRWHSPIRLHLHSALTRVDTMDNFLDEDERMLMWRRGMRPRRRSWAPCYRDPRTYRLHAQSALRMQRSATWRRVVPGVAIPAKPARRVRVWRGSDILDLVPLPDVPSGKTRRRSANPCRSLFPTLTPSQIKSNDITAQISASGMVTSEQSLSGVPLDNPLAIRKLTRMIMIKEKPQKNHTVLEKIGMLWLAYDSLNMCHCNNKPKA